MNKEERSTYITIKDETQPAARPFLSDIVKVMNQIRKWECHFDRKNPLAFLKRVEELRQDYGYTGDQFLLGRLSCCEAIPFSGITTRRGPSGETSSRDFAASTFPTDIECSWHRKYRISIPKKT